MGLLLGVFVAGVVGVDLLHEEVSLEVFDELDLFF